MKNFSFAFLLLMVCAPLKVAAMTWDEASNILYDIIAEIAEDQKDFLIKNKLGSDVDLGYVTKENCIDYVVVLNNPRDVTSMSDSELKENAEEIISDLIAAIESFDDLSLTSLLTPMQKAGGKIRICYKAIDKGQPVRKALFFSAADIKRISESSGQDFPSPEGRTYTGRANGMNVTFKFVDDNNVEMTYNDGRNVSKLYGHWYQDEDYVYISAEEGEPFQISSDGKTLYDIVNRVTLKAVK